MYNLHRSPEQLQIRDTVRDFVAEVIKPLALKPERLEARARPHRSRKVGCRAERTVDGLHRAKRGIEPPLHGARSARGGRP
jgi:hypothetical protein